jgi:hypothetical protein
VTIANARDTFQAPCGGYFAWRAMFVPVGVLGIGAFAPAVENPPLVSLQERLSVVGPEPLSWLP